MLRTASITEQEIKSSIQPAIERHHSNEGSYLASFVIDAALDVLYTHDEQLSPLAEIHARHLRLRRMASKVMGLTGISVQSAYFEELLKAQTNPEHDDFKDTYIMACAKVSIPTFNTIRRASQICGGAHKLLQESCITTCDEATAILQRSRNLTYLPISNFQFFDSLVPYRQHYLPRYVLRLSHNQDGLQVRYTEPVEDEVNSATLIDNFNNPLLNHWGRLTEYLVRADATTA